MDSRRNRMRMDAKVDRLSSLPDDLIFKIMSFVGLKDAIGTSVLSTRWRFLWTSIPHLSFSSEDFPTMDKLSDFVTRVLSNRDNQALLSSFKLYISGKDGQDIAQRIMSHAFSLNVQQLNFTCLFKRNVGFPLTISSSQTLKHLTLSRSFGKDHIMLTSTGEFSSLTTLCLYRITICDGFFSMCPNLENLTLNGCSLMGSNGQMICHPRLANLTLHNANMLSDTFSVVTPQLKNLSITKLQGRYIISAPKLVSLFLRGYCPFMFTTDDGFHYLEKAQLSFHNLKRSQVPKIISLLQKLHNVKLLSLCVEIIKFLNCSVNLISHQPSPFANLKSLKILPKVMCRWKHEHMRVNMSMEVKNYLLNSSPKATVTEVLREQCCDVAAGADYDSI